MKFIKYFFLLASVLMLNEIAAASKSGENKHYSIKDTIIKLDSVRDRRLLRLKKPVAKAPADTSKKQQGGLTSKLKTVGDSIIRTSNGKTNIIYIYGNGRITYEDFELDAQYIQVDENTHQVFASGLIDPKTHQYINRPIYKQKDQKPVESDSLRMDYTTKKGKIYNEVTEQDGNFISGGLVKKLNETEFAYRNVIFSTCNKPYPDTDFGIVIHEGIAEKNRIIARLAYLEIGGVPLPLGLPFGFFPKPDTRASGVILPTFGEDQTLGFFLRNFGYYFGFNDYVDLTTMGSFYSKGSYELSASSHYFKRYNYSGNVSLSYGSHNYGLEGDPFQKDFNVTWSHSQDANAHPGTTFSASVNAGTSSYYQNNPATTNYSLTQLTQNNLHSSIAFGKTWAGTPFNFTANLSHSQDLTRKVITLELPSFNFNMATISPFDDKDRVGTQKWYQKITVGYTLQGTNKVTDIPESILFKGNTLSRRLQSGFEHQIPVGLSLNILKYFQFSTSANYIERWYLQTTTKRYGRSIYSGLDSLITDTVGGFRRVGEYSLSASISTKVYARMNFKKGSLEAIRDVITPSIGFSYRPDYSGLDHSFNQFAVSNATIPYPYTVTRYSIFDQSVYGGPSGGRSAGVSLSVDNTIEGKKRALSTDTAGKSQTFSILQGLSFSTFYNMAADSFKLSPINFSAHTSILHQKVNINFGGVFDPYVVNVRDSIQNNSVQKYIHRYNRFTFQDGRLPVLTSFNLSASASLNPAAFRPTQLVQNNTLNSMTQAQSDRLALINSDPGAYVDFNVPWNLSVNYSFSYNNNYTNTVISNTMMFSGDFTLTKGWKVQGTTNYDFKVQKFSSATSFSIYRDLHCWDLSIHWIPFGVYKSYSVDLKVKASILQDLKLSKRKDYYNN